MIKTSPEKIKLHFWGVRGSLPTPPDNQEIEDKIVDLLKKAARQDLSDDETIRKFIQSQPVYARGIIGGNTACVSIEADGKYIILDAGTGLRKLGDLLMENEFANGNGTAHIFLSHTHWDHISGFPFFRPAYVPGNQIYFYGCHNSLERRISYQQEDEFFPVSISAMAANIEFKRLKKEEAIKLDRIKISNSMLYHPGGSFGYRLEYRGKSVVYATDSEYRDLFPDKMESFLGFIRDADILIFDSHFTIHESSEKENWGHSTAIQGVDFAVQAGVRHLLLFHHNPYYSDNQLVELLENARSYAAQFSDSLQISLAHEGLEINL